MSYYAGFAPSEELMEKYNVKEQSKEKLNELQLSLIAFCMVNSEISSRVYNNISSNLSYIQSIVEKQIKKEIYNQWKDTGEVWFAGRQFSEPSDFDTEENLQYAIKRLYELSTIIPTPDWYDEEEKFFMKLNELESIINGFIEDIEDNVRHEVIDYLTENKAKIIGDNKLEENAD